MKYLLMLLYCTNVFAADQWFCTEESGKRDGDIIWACGVGEGDREMDARNEALRGALKEFQLICSASSECKNRPTYVEPKRLSCTQDKHGFWKCYRMVSILLGK